MRENWVKALCQCLQKSDGRPGKIGRTAKIRPILAVHVNEGLGRETLFMMINDDQKLTTISMFTMISMSKIHNHRQKIHFVKLSHR